MTKDKNIFIISFGYVKDNEGITYIIDYNNDMTFATNDFVNFSKKVNEAISDIDIETSMFRL